MAGLDQALRFIDQQHQAGNQQRQYHVDHAIQQQRRGQWGGAERVGKRGQQNRFEHPDPAGDMAEHACGQGQQIDQQEGTERRSFWQ